MELSNMTADQLQALSMAAKSDVVIQKICKRGKFLFWKKTNKFQKFRYQKHNDRHTTRFYRRFFI